MTTFNSALTKCKHADKYAAVQPPRCGCDICAYTWLLTEWVGQHGDTVTVRQALLYEDGLKAALAFRRNATRYR